MREKVVLVEVRLLAIQKALFYLRDYSQSEAITSETILEPLLTLL